MRARLGVAELAERPARDLAAASRSALDRALAADAELSVSIVADDALVAGAFQRRPSPPHSLALVRRGSGGPEVRAAPGTIHVALALANPGVMLHPDPKRIVNRAVRPLLRALTRKGFTAHFFGRDWVSVSHVPVAWVGFGHDATTRRTLFEAFVAVTAPFADAPRASFAGKVPTTLDALAAGRPVDVWALAGTIAEAYAEGHETATRTRGPAADLDTDANADADVDPAWAATIEEAIGILGAGPDARGVFRVGGDLLASRDAIAHLEASVGAAGPDVPDAAVGQLVDDALARPEVALDGVRSLASVRDVIVRALPRRARP
jgi:hypothetical protein